MAKSTIKKAADFQIIINKKKSFGNDIFRVHYLKKNQGPLKFGIAVGKKKFKLAVKRNYIKRWVRMILQNDQVKNLPYDIIVMVVAFPKQITFIEFEKKLLGLLEKLKG